MNYRAEIRVTLRPGVLDTQGKAVGEALGRLGFEGIGETRVGKWIELDVEADDAKSAEATVDACCTRLLAHPVVERYAFAVEPAEEVKDR